MIVLIGLLVAVAWVVMGDYHKSDTEDNNEEN